MGWRSDVDKSLNAQVGDADSGAMPTTKTMAQWLTSHARTVLWAAFAMTLALSIPMIFMAPTETASQSPSNAVTNAQDTISDSFAPPVHEVPLILEATEGNILDPDVLRSLFRQTTELRSDSKTGPFLRSRYSPELATEINGVHTIADAINQSLLSTSSVGLLAAQDSAIQETATALIDQAGPFAWGLSQHASQDNAGHWTSAALVLFVEADNEALGGGTAIVAIGAEDLTKEHYSRDVLRVLTADQEDFNAWTIATDVNLTSIEQGTRAGPFIGMTVFVVLVILLLAFRSYWLTAISGLTLGALMIWLQGLSNLVGLENDQLLATIVPISMISFGIDSAFHVYGRYREEGSPSVNPRRAFTMGTAAILSPVALALSSDSAAFLSNLSSPIESVQQFGIASAMAATSAFLLLGIVTPLAVSEIDELLPSTGLGNKKKDLLVGAAAAGGATLPVMILIFVSPSAGLGLLLAYGAIAVLLPLYRASRKQPDNVADQQRQSAPADLPFATSVERVATTLAQKPRLTLAGAFVFTAFMLSFAVRVGPSFKVTDYFSPDVDFVVGLDKINEHLGPQGGERAALLIETDLADPQTLQTTADFVAELRASSTGLLAHDANGLVLNAGVIDLVHDAMLVGNSVPGVEPTWQSDNDSNQLPDSRQDFQDLVDAVSANGLLDETGNTLWTPETVSTVLASNDTTGLMTQFIVEIPDTRSQEAIDSVRAFVEPLTESLAADLAASSPGSAVTFTGSPVFRDEQLGAIIQSLVLSLPIAIVICLILAAAFTRSLRLGFLSIVPLLLVVTWLYGFMELAGFGVNVVTATIGAISIGVGIDFATHMTMRLQEEYQQHETPEAALRAALGGTGTALTGSAMTSIAGFGILAFAPMPMFATYGLLTAMMIFFALVAAVGVLPSLLVEFGGLTITTPGPALVETSVAAIAPVEHETAAAGETSTAQPVTPAALSVPTPRPFVDAALRQPRTAVLRLALSPDLDPGLKTRIARMALAADAPSNVSVMSEQEMLAGLRAGTIDVAIGSEIGDNTGPTPPAGSSRFTLQQEPVWLAAAVGSALPSLEALQTSTWITGPAGSTWESVTNEALASLKISPTDIREFPSSELAAAVLTSGQSVCVFGEAMAQLVKSDGVHVWPLMGLVADRQVNLLVRREVESDMLVRQLLAGLVPQHDGSELSSLS